MIVLNHKMSFVFKQAQDHCSWMKLKSFKTVNRMNLLRPPHTT